MLSFAGAGLAAMAVSSQRGIAWAQVREEAENEPIAIVRKGIDKYLNVINVDLLEADAKSKLSECVYVFISHGAGEQWTLRENLRAFGDYSFVPQRMGGVGEALCASRAPPLPTSRRSANPHLVPNGSKCT
jgi:lactate oxidase